jgi:isopropylmalate/homocitrate/citramalate synthase
LIKYRIPMIDRQKLWTGPINELALEGEKERFRHPVGLYDTTLRDGEQTVGVVLDPEAKLRIARALDALGIERIEAGFPRVSADDAAAIRDIMAAGLDAEVWGFSRAHPDDVEALLALGVQAAVIEAPVSDGKLDAYGMSRDKIVERVTKAIGHASNAGMRIAFFGVDGSRADLGFLERIYAAAVEAGAKEVVVVDTLGAATPEAAALMVERARGWVGDEVPVHWHGHNDFGLATAAAIAAVGAGARWIQGTINGMGERAGNANLGELALALDALYGAELNMRFEKLVETAQLVQELSGYALEPWKPVTGENLFVRESGAVASQFHDPSAIEPFSSEIVQARRGLVLGKKSGLDSIRIKADELGLEVPEERRAAVLAQVKKLGAERRRLVSDDEFRAIVEGAP